jgi:pilus assembly protein Flp/PilA
MARRISDFIRDERGATAIEYGLIATLIALVIIVAVTGVGTSLKGGFNNVGNIIK